MSVKASIVIPTYNMREELERNLRSLERQTEPDFEVVVVDDGSTDGTIGYLKRFRGEIQLRYISHGQNRGRAAARNSGIRSAKGDVVILLDSDMVVRPSFVASHLFLHTEKRRVVVGNVLLAPWVSRSAISKYLETRGAHRLRTSTPPFTFFATGNASVGRGFILDTGLFDEEIAEYGVEDLEMGYRLFKKGALFAYGKDAISYHNHHYRLEDVLERVRISGERSVPIILRKHPELKETLRLNLLEPVSLRTDTPGVVVRKLLLALCLREKVYLSLKSMVDKRTGSYLPALVFDYLLFYNRAAGFQRVKSASHL